MAQIGYPVFTGRVQGGAYDDEPKADTHEVQVHDSEDKVRKQKTKSMKHWKQRRQSKIKETKDCKVEVHDSEDKSRIWSRTWFCTRSMSASSKLHDEEGM